MVKVLRVCIVNHISHGFKDFGVTLWASLKLNEKVLVVYSNSVDFGKVWTITNFQPL